jgi:hypothetical protein
MDNRQYRRHRRHELSRRRIFYPKIGILIGQMKRRKTPIYCSRIYAPVGYEWIKHCIVPYLDGIAPRRLRDHLGREYSANYSDRKFRTTRRYVNVLRTILDKYPNLEFVVVDNLCSPGTERVYQPVTSITCTQLLNEVDKIFLGSDR